MNMTLKGKITQMLVRLMTAAATTGVAEQMIPSVRK